MDINVENLDLGYDQCKSLNDLVKDGSNAYGGEKVLNDLKDIIGKLKIHWIASDALEHINNLIGVYSAQALLITDAKKLTFSAGESIIAIQNLRHMNGGAGRVDSSLDGTPSSGTNIPNVEPTDKYYVDPNIDSDYQQLVEINKNFSDFVQRFQQNKEELLKNWTAGANHDEAVKFFNSFDENCATYKKHITNAEEELGKVVANIKQVA